MLLAPLITHSNEQPLGKLWSAVYMELVQLRIYIQRRRRESPHSKARISPMNHLLSFSFVP